MTIVTGVDFVSVPSNDLPAAREFYADVLGLEASQVYQRPGEDAVGAAPGYPPNAPLGRVN